MNEISFEDDYFERVMWKLPEFLINKKAFLRYIIFSSSFHTSNDLFPKWIDEANVRG